MKRIFLMIFILALISLPAFAQQDLPQARAIKNDQLRQDTFDLFQKTIYCNLAAGKHVTPTDIVSTGTFTTAYLTDVPTGPIKIRIQNLGTTGRIFMKEYSTSAAGVPAVTATDAYIPSAINSNLATYTTGQLIAGEVYEQVFYGTPNTMFGAVEAATFTLTVTSQQLP